jgi:hypothetical protein
METSTIVIVGAVGVGAWWLWSRRSRVPVPASVATPNAASHMTNAGAAATDVGSPVVAGIARTVVQPQDNGFPGGRSEWVGTPSTGQSIRRTAQGLAVADATPPPPPTASPNIGRISYPTTLGGASVQGVGASTMGPQPLAYNKSMAVR